MGGSSEAKSKRAPYDFPPYGMACVSCLALCLAGLTADIYKLGEAMLKETCEQTSTLLRKEYGPRWKWQLPFTPCFGLVGNEQNQCN